MKERPILFSAPMVRALLNGTKTQTRRVVQPQPPADKQRAAWYEPGVMGWAPPEVPSQHWHRVRCPYGQPGDRLWVREAWRTVAAADALPPRDLTPAHRIWYETDTSLSAWRGLAELGKLRPGMFMPRWASRITLDVTGVRVERLQDISAADAIAEGIERAPSMGKPGAFQWCDYRVPNEPSEWFNDPVRSYQTLWEEINGTGSWDLNPWVWVVEFKRLGAA